MKSFFVTAAAALLLAGFGAAPAAKADVLSNFDLPFGFNVPAPCSSDTIALNGDAHFLLHVTTDNAGGISGGLHINVEAHGVGTPSGLKYTGNAILDLNGRLTPGNAANLTAIVNVRLLAQGKAPDLKAHLNLHVTYDANGNLTAEVINFNLDPCN